MSMQFSNFSENSPARRLIWWSTKSTKEKKLIVACAVVSVLAIIFCICTIALGSKKKCEDNCINKGNIPTVQTDGTTTTTSTGAEITTPTHIIPASSPTTRSDVSSIPTTAESKTQTATKTGPEITTSTTDDELCSSTSCIETANELVSKIKEDANPCDNFFSFACGRFEDTQRKGTRTLDLVTDEFAADVKDVLESADPEGLKNPATKSAVRLYRKCKMQDPLGNKGRDAVRELVKEVLGTDWPIAVGDNWNETSFDMMQSFARLVKLDQYLYINFQVFQDLDKPFFLSSLIDTETELQGVNMPLNLTHLVCTLYPDCQPNATLDRILDQSDSYASRILNADENPPALPATTADMLREVKKSSKIYTITDLEKEAPKVQWRHFIETIFNGTDFKITENFSFRANASELAQIINELEKRKRDTANFIGWFVAQKWGKLLSTRLRHAWFPVQLVDDLCSEFVSDVFEYAVGNMYINKHLPADAMSEIKSITTRIKDGFKTILDNSPWLDKDTHNMALKKLQNMETAIAAPEWIWKDDAVMKYYEDAEIFDNTTFEEAALMAMRNKVNQKLRKVDETIDRKNYWPIKIFETNAQYYPLTNTMYYQLGILRRPCYVNGRFGYINLGALGYIAGHELTHGFDWNGKDFDENGLMNNWWKEEALKKFEDGARCFITQYSNIQDNVSGEKINGTLTLSENIADNGGLKAAFQAFINSGDVKTEKLIGLENLKDQQIFFVSAAQIWCAKLSKDMMSALFSGYEHAPDMYRSIVPFQNFPEFSKAFNCEIGSNMNPVNKCSVW